MRHVAFCGKMRSGKDTAAAYEIKSYFPTTGIILKFADPLYELESLIYNYIGYPIPSDKTKRRSLLQYIGTDFGRLNVDPDIWVKLAEKHIMEKFKKDIFITDARFPNEIHLLDKLDFHIIKINVDENIRIQRGATNLTHESETALDNFDFSKLQTFSTITNNGSLEDFYKQLDEVFNLQ